MMQRRRLAAILSGVSSRTAAADEAGVAVLEADAVEILLPSRHTSKAGSISVRRATPRDIPSLRGVTHYGFASNTALPTDVEVPDELEDEQTWGAFEGDRAVAQLYAHDWTLGGGAAGCRLAAVSGVGTLPEFRRLGLLRTMMSILFKDMMEKGQHIAGLLATQYVLKRHLPLLCFCSICLTDCLACLCDYRAAIYQRYGYSEAVRSCVISL